MSKKTHFTATLCMQVRFEIDHDACKESKMDPDKVKDELLHQFGKLPERISGEGMLTYDLPAEADSWDSQILVTHG